MKARFKRLVALGKKYGAGVIAAGAYVSTVVAANYAIKRFGIIPVGFGYMAPAGVYLVGLALVLRDYVQWSLGKLPMLAALATGIGLSYAISTPALAFASAVAFGFSELADFALFSRLAPLWGKAVLAGGIAGAVIDSALFLWLAFGALAFMPGQVIGKLYGVVAAAILVGLRRRVAATA